MSYPMDYQRIIRRGGVEGNYSGTSGKSVHPIAPDGYSVIAGDLRRLEHDTLDDQQLWLYAKTAGISIGEAQAVLHAFFYGIPHEVWDEAVQEIGGTLGHTRYDPHKTCTYDGHRVGECEKIAAPPNKEESE